MTVDWQGAESVTIHNTGAAPVNLHRWWLRDSLQRCGKRGVRFKKKAVLAPGASTVVDVRTARCPDGTLAWKKRDSTKPLKDVFPTPSGGPAHMGGGAYLFDPDGDIRAAHQYGPAGFHHTG